MIFGHQGFNLVVVFFDLVASRWVVMFDFAALVFPWLQVH